MKEDLVHAAIVNVVVIPDATPLRPSRIDL